MAYKPTPNEFNNNYPVAGWNRNTVADGNWLNNNTIKPLQERDVFLLELINEKADEYETRDAEASLNESFNNLKQEIEDTFSLSAGHNIRIDEDPDGKTLTINAIDTPTDKFVTSAINTFENGKSYTLEKNGNTTKWVGYDLSDIGKTYYEGPNIKITDDYHISGRDWDPELDNLKQYVDGEIQDIAQDVIDLTEDLSEFEREVEEDLSECVTSADFTFENGLSYVLEKDGDNNPTWVGYDLNDIGGKVNILGNNGVSAGFNESTETWEIGLSANNFAYMYDTYTNNGAALIAGTILKFEGTNRKNITVDSDGYIVVPETVNKFTICINETIENNNPGTHSYLLNKIALKTDTPEQLVASQNYYPTEVGSSNANISITVDHTVNPTRKYAVVYDGSDIASSAQFNTTISIIEEVVSMAEVIGQNSNYTGDSPIYVANDSKHIGLNYDTDMFSIVDNKLTIDVHTSEGDIDAEAFEKMATLINSRMTETFPIGLVCDEGTVNANTCISYLFRPSMTYDCTTATSAFIYNGNVDTNECVARVGIYELKNNIASLIWKSAPTTLISNTQNSLSADTTDVNPVTGTISTDNLYYACILTNNKQINNILGIHGNGTADVGNPKPWCVVNNIATTGGPFSNTDFSATVSFNDFGSFTASIKPYIGLRGSIE